MDTNMLEKIQELPQEIVNNIYRFMKHPIAKLFKERISFVYYKTDVLKHSLKPSIWTDNKNQTMLVIKYVFVGY